MSKTDDLDSSSRGIWVFPHKPTDPEAGPSRPKQTRPLKEFYFNSLQAYRSAYEVYEYERAEDQLDDLTHWLNHYATSGIAPEQFHRLPVAVLQRKKVHEQLYTILGQASEVVGVQGRDVVDVGSGIRGIVTGLMGDSGMTGLDLLETWWSRHKHSPTIIIHIQDAQVIPPQILGEIIYIITLHPKIPFRLLLSVPSTSTFLSQWQLLEPSSIDLTILQIGLGRGKRQNALGAILDIANTDSETDAKKAKTKITVGDDLAEVLKRDEVMFGHGPERALKAIQWGMLHHSSNSALATISFEHSDQYLAAIEAIINDTSPNLIGDIERDLFRLSAESDLAHVTDPSPRISILQALANTSSFTAHLPTHTNDNDTDVNMNGNADNSPSTPKKRKPRHAATETNGTTPIINSQMETTQIHPKGDLGDLEVLYNLWKGAGKQVNLWDWLHGYKNHITGAGAGDGDEAEADDHDDDGAGAANGDEGDQKRENGGEPKRKRKHEDVDVDEDRLHATFVRFCEEARMLGMVRARGKAVGRKADEVVKGVTLL